MTRREAEEIARSPDLVRTHITRDRHVIADHLAKVVQDAQRVDRISLEARAPRPLVVELPPRLGQEIRFTGKGDLPEAVCERINRRGKAAHELDRRLVRPIDRRGDLVQVDHLRLGTEPLGRVVFDQVVADTNDDIRVFEQPVRGLVVRVAYPAGKTIE